MITTSVEELQELCREWQKRLNLRHWDVAVEIVRTRKMESDSAAIIDRNINHQVARIRILHPDDYPEDCMKPCDMEIDLVHELIHIYFAPYMNDDDDNPIHIAQEQTIEQLARALVRLKRDSVGIRVTIPDMPNLHLESGEENK